MNTITLPQIGSLQVAPFKLVGLQRNVQVVLSPGDDPLSVDGINCLFGGVVVIGGFNSGQLNCSWQSFSADQWDADRDAWVAAGWRCDKLLEVIAAELKRQFHDGALMFGPEGLKVQNARAELAVAETDATEAAAHLCAMKKQLQEAQAAAAAWTPEAITN